MQIFTSPANYIKLVKNHWNKKKEIKKRHKVYHYEDRESFSFIRYFISWSTLHRNALAVCAWSLTIQTCFDRIAIESLVGKIYIFIYFLNLLGFLDAHNKKRSLHQNTQPLSWDQTLADSSRAWAEKLINENGGKLMHCKERGNDIGENLFVAMSTREHDTNKIADKAIGAW